MPSKSPNKTTPKKKTASPAKKPPAAKRRRASTQLAADAAAAVDPPPVPQAKLGTGGGLLGESPRLGSISSAVQSPAPLQTVAEVCLVLVSTVSLMRPRDLDQPS
jgi:hypothetical protein